MYFLCFNINNVGTSPLKAYTSPLSEVIAFSRQMSQGLGVGVVDGAAGAATVGGLVDELFGPVQQSSQRTVH